jgi:hypothetical protein
VSSRGTKSVSWWEPKWSFRAGIFQRWNEQLGWKACKRIFIVSGIIVVAIFVVCRFLAPNLQFNWLAAFLEAVALFAVYLLMIFGLDFFLPPNISIRKKGIQIQDGQTAHLYKQNEIVSCRLVSHGLERISLWFSMEKESRRVGVSPKVKLAELQELLGEKLVIALLDDNHATAVQNEALEP